MTGIVLFAHGSTVATANDAVRAVTADLVGRIKPDVWETAFLDCAAPTLAEAVENVAARGAGRIVVVPYFLTLGIHLQRDLPAIIQEIKERHPELRIDVTDPLDGHPKLVEIVVDRVRSAFDGSGGNRSTAD